MEKLLLSKSRYTRKANHSENDDLIDRINSRYTVGALMLAVLVVSLKMYIGSPINCWTPAQFSGTHNEYTSSICWLKGTYYLPTDENVIPERTKPRENFVSYYQWTPYFLLLMGLFFHLPQLFWRYTTHFCGIHLEQMIKNVKEQPDPKKAVDDFCTIFDQYLKPRKKGKTARSHKSWLTVLYFISKVIYIVNVILQFFILNRFLAFNLQDFGAETLVKFFTNSDTFESRRFPRITMCDFMIRHLGSNQHWYAVQCNLPINMYNEKIFFLIWVWLIILIVLNCLSLVYWICTLLPSQKRIFLKKLISVKRSEPLLERLFYQEDKDSATILPDKLKEIENYFGYDGYLIFRFLVHNTDYIFGSSVLLAFQDKIFPRPDPRISETVDH